MPNSLRNAVAFSLCLLFALFAQVGPVSAQTTTASYAGTYSGTFSGGDSGSFTAVIASSGSISLTGSSSVEGAISGSGQVSSAGSLQMTAGSTSTGSTFTGTIDPTSGALSGTWLNSAFGVGGSFAGTRTSAPVTTTTTTSTTTTSATVATTTSTTQPTGGAGVPLNLNPGWNLLGNSSATPIDVAVTFGDVTKITSVWKWIQSASTWAFYAPSISPSALTAYAQGKGYDVLTSIAPKEGFWVNATAGAALSGPTASAVTLAETDLQAGWNLVGSADGKTPSQLNQGLSSSLNAAGKAIVTAWAWDAPNAAWKFYAPALEAQGGTALADYVSSKGYLPFGTALSTSDGFWVNVGAASPASPPGQPASVVSASGAVAYGIYPDSFSAAAGVTAVTGSFAPSADGFETEVTEGMSTLYRWIDKTSNTRIEVARGIGDLGWDAYLVSNSGEPYVMGTGTGFSPGHVGLCSAGGCKVTVTGGTSLEKTVTVAFQALKPIGTAGTSTITGTLTGSANDFIWTPFDLPASTSGSIDYGGQSHDILSAYATSDSVTANGTTYKNVSFSMRTLERGSVYAPKKEGPPSAFLIRSTVSIGEPGFGSMWNCSGNYNDTTCDFDSPKRSDGTTRLYFPNVPITNTNTRPVTNGFLTGAVVFGQASSSLTINGSPFTIDTDDYSRNWLASYVSAVGATVQYQFLDNSGTAQIANYIQIWVRNGVVTQVRIPAAQNSQFMCVEKPMLSTNNWWAGGAGSPAYTIPACAGITVSSFPGEGMRIFNFNNFTMNVAPSVFVTPTTTITLNGTLVAKGR